MLPTTYSNDYLPESVFPSARIVEFCRYLRENGMQTTTRDVELLTEVLVLAGGVVSARKVESLWRPVVCRSLKEWRAWSELFQLFWFPHKTKGTVKVTGSTRRSRHLKEMVERSQSMAGSGPGSASVVGDTPAGSDEIQAQDKRTKSAGGASVVDPLDRDYESQWMPADLTLLERIARKVRAQLLTVPTRRWRMSDRGRTLDLRKTSQSLIQFAGDGMIPRWRAHRRETPQIVMVIDVSRSMESYASFYLRLARAFARSLPVRVFVFHVRHAEISEFLTRDNPQIQEKIDAVTAGFLGGTKIASSLKGICFDEKSVSLNRRTRVWVFSDGYDTDKPTLLRDVLRRIRGRGAAIEWFYPNKTVAGMSQCVRLARDLVKNWYGAGNLSEIDLSLRQLG